MKENKNLQPEFLSFRFLNNDIPAGLVVFLVALPLCLGIALASGAPLFSGLIAGIAGGLVVAVLSGSQLAVSGPAAGLTVIVLDAIKGLGSFEAFLLAVVLAGGIQIILGYIKAGTIGNYFPSSVIKGMLAAIGIILILKQIPHAVGYDKDYEGDFAFIQMDEENSFSEIVNSINKSHPGAIIISILCLAVLIAWDTKAFKKFRSVPGPLIAVITGIAVNLVYRSFIPDLELKGDHLVSIPAIGDFGELKSIIITPDFSLISSGKLWITAVTLAVVASLETLLSIEAIDKLDPLRRKSSANRELKAQGVGNIVSGLIGGLPLTAVIVRGSANVASGAKTRTSAFFHGLFLLASLLLIPGILNLIPLASLAAVLLVVGYKLTKLRLFGDMYKAGWDQFIPFASTLLAIVFTDLLKGIAIGMVIGIFIILRRTARHHHYRKGLPQKGEPVLITLAEEVSFLNKASIQLTLEELPEDSYVIVDGTRSVYIDYDVLEILHSFRDNAHFKNLKVEFKGIKDVYRALAH
jgi:MFS superfamily sulfate permease-like transporter